MESTKDLVSVIIPTYNRAHLIKRSAQSVLNQTYSNLELIIVDDGSTDNTEEVVKSIDDNRVIYIKQPNQGACAARNNGIDHARGEFIAFQDSDDVWHYDKLEKQIKCLKETGADMCFCSLNKIENGKSVGLIGNHFERGFQRPSVLLSNVGTQTLCGKSNIFKTEKFDSKMPRLQDLELLWRIQKKFSTFYINESLVDYYLQEDSITNNFEKIEKACVIIMEKHKDFVNNQKLVNFILHVAFISHNNSFKSNVFDTMYSNNTSFRTKIRIIAYKLGVRNLYLKLKRQ